MAKTETFEGVINKVTDSLVSATMRDAAGTKTFVKWAPVDGKLTGGAIFTVGQNVSLSIKEGRLVSVRPA